VRRGGRVFTGEDGRTCDIARSLKNVRDPYPGVGPVLTGLMPADVGATMPQFPTIDQVIAAFARRPRDLPERAGNTGPGGGH